MAWVAVSLALSSCSGLRAWPGHDWNQWKQVTTWTKAELRTRQAGRGELTPLLGGGSSGLERITSVRGWEERRAEIAQAIRQIMGQADGLKPPPVEVRVTSEQVLADHVRRRVEIRSEPDEWIPAYLLLPKAMPASPPPAMICLHQTVSQGKEEPCGIRGDPELALALELVRRGYVCLAPDVIGFGERIPPGQQPYHDNLKFFKRHPGWSCFGKMVWDVSRVIDYLETLPFVDAKRIGSIGHSHGAYGTLFAAAFEPRIALAIASCGFTTFRSDPRPERWSHATPLLPQLGLYLPDVASIPFDWHEVCALAAPRPLFIWYATQDAIFPATENLDGLLKDVRRVYELYEAAGSLTWQAFDGPHQFTQAGRMAAYRWLDQQWGGTSKEAARASAKRSSAFFPAELAARAQANCRNQPWGIKTRQAMTALAEPWLKLSDAQLWGLMFGNTLRRSWMVWSNGHCPACRQPVPMYEWSAAAMTRPWKLACPRCGELFPKNDFERFYRSGLDDQGVFDPARADRALLFDIEHPDPADPLHRFGVDDGEGYVEEGKRWRFIGAYLIFGQWKQAVVGGIRNLAAAYVVTGDPLYAHKAGVLLDRVADLYPTFDFGKEGVLYEGPARSGYVSTWHDACVEVQDLALAYDQVFEALAKDEELARFLAGQAAKHKLANPKTSFAHIQRNLEERIFQDTLDHRYKIESNYPSTDVTMLTIKTVLAWPANRAVVTAMLDSIITRATAVDGLTGEKGLAGYSVIAPRTLLEVLGLYSRMDPEFFAATCRRHPRLRAMYRFHLDTWCLGQYYPCSGDTGSFAEKSPSYAAVSFSRSPAMNPSAYTFLWDLYEATDDKDFVRLLYAANNSTVEGLPYDLFCADPAAFQGRVAKVLAQCGAAMRVESVNKTEWCLGILRSGQGEHARAAWLDYDSGGGHGHADGMNLGLFAKGLDLLPDFGYPPVQYGGWQAPRAVWYTQTAAHNTVEVDGRNLRTGKGQTAFWFSGEDFHLLQASGPQLAGGEAYARTVALIDLTEHDFYLIDLFRVVGGQEHTKYLHSHFGRISTSGLNLEPAEEPRFGELMRGFKKDARPESPWQVDWQVENLLKYAPAPKDLHFRCTDATANAEVLTGEAWVAVGMFGGSAEAWIPRVLVRRRATQPPLSSTFVSVLEPYEETPNLGAIRRLVIRDAEGNVCPETHVGLEIGLAGGGRDLFLAVNADGLGRKPADADRPAPGRNAVSASDIALQFEGEFCLARVNAEGKPSKVLLGRARWFRLGDLVIQTKHAEACLEIAFVDGRARVAAGSAEELESIAVEAIKLWPK